MLKNSSQSAFEGDKECQVNQRTGYYKIQGNLVQELDDLVAPHRPIFPPCDEARSSIVPGIVAGMVNLKTTQTWMRG